MKLPLRENYNYSPRRALIECSAGAAAVCYDVQHFALSAGRARPLRAEPSPGRKETPIPAARHLENLGRRKGNRSIDIDELSPS